MKLFFGTFDLDAEAFEKGKKKGWEEYGKKIFFGLHFTSFFTLFFKNIKLILMSSRTYLPPA
jgi:hypothetical protein